MVEAGVVLQIGKFNVVRLENTHQLFKGDDEIDIAADVLPHCLQLFGSAWTDKDHAGVRVLFLDDAGSGYHRGHRVRNAVGNLRELLLCHHNPGRAAGGCQKRQLAGRHILDVLLGFLHRTDVRTAGNLIDVGKADFAQGSAHLFRRCQRTELTDERRSHLGNDLVAALDCLNQLENLGLVRNRAERAADQTLSTGNALVVVDFCPSVLVAFDGVHSASRCAGTFALDNGGIWASLCASSALDAFALIDVGSAVHDRNCLDRTNGCTWMCDTASAQVGDGVAGFLTGVARKGDHVDQRRFIEHIRNGAVVDSL